jgi:hypothetical protein
MVELEGYKTNATEPLQSDRIGKVVAVVHYFLPFSPDLEVRARKPAH